MTREYYKFLRKLISDKAFSDTASVVTRTPITKTTSNLYGTETLTEGSTEEITVYMVKQVTNQYFDKMGEIKAGDAIMLAQYDQTINKNDKITFAGQDYRVDVVHPVYESENIVYKKCNLFYL